MNKIKLRKRFVVLNSLRNLAESIVGVGFNFGYERLKTEKEKLVWAKNFKFANFFLEKTEDEFKKLESNFKSL